MVVVSSAARNLGVCWDSSRAYGLAAGGVVLVGLSFVVGKARSLPAVEMTVGGRAAQVGHASGAVEMTVGGREAQVGTPQVGLT